LSVLFDILKVGNLVFGVFYRSAKFSFASPGRLLGGEDVGLQLLDPLLVEVAAVLHLLAPLF
jgi:hypothetical protein